MDISFEYHEFSNTEETITVPAKYEICDRCDGKGSYVNPAIDGNGLSREDFDEQGPEFFEDYMSGLYDIRCEECNGLRVVLVPDKQKMFLEELRKWEEAEEERYLARREREEELRMGY